MALAVAGVAVAAGVGLEDGLIFLLQFGVPAVLLMEGIRRAMRTEFTVIAVALALSLGVVLILILTAEHWRQPLDLIRDRVQGVLAEMETVSARFGLAAEPGAEAVPLAKLRGFLMVAFPGLFFTTGLLIASANLVLIQGVLRRWAPHFENVAAPVFTWTMPEPLVWAFIGSGLLYLTGLPWLYGVGINGLIVLIGLYFLQGLSIAAFLFERFRLPRFLATLSVVLLVFQPFFTLLVAGLGLFDVWFAFRRLSLPKSPRQT